MIISSTVLINLFFVTFFLGHFHFISFLFPQNIGRRDDDADTQQRFSGSLDDGRTSSSHSHFHYQHPRRSPGNSLKRKRCLIDGGGSRTSLKSNGDDEDTLRQLLDE